MLLFLVHIYHIVSGQSGLILVFLPFRLYKLIGPVSSRNYVKPSDNLISNCDKGQTQLFDPSQTTSPLLFCIVLTNSSPPSSLMSMVLISHPYFFHSFFCISLFVWIVWLLIIGCTVLPNAIF